MFYERESGGFSTGVPVPDSSHRAFGRNLKSAAVRTCHRVGPAVPSVAQGNKASTPRETHLSARPGVISICLFNLLNLLVSSAGRA